IREIDAALAEKGWVAAGVYADLATRKAADLPFEITSPTLEGYLFPETYKIVPSRFSAEELIERQLALFRDRFLAHHPEGFGQRTLHDVVVVASMLEREEPKPANRPLVSGVIWKRLDTGWELGIDATSRYTLADWNDRDAFLKLLKDPDDAYGTRVRKGLPPTAIGNPATESLEAAAAPIASEYWYYLHDPQGNLHPARDAAGHEANRTKYGVR
nr:endolytic transglycosylase MltG [Deltaproteobacteria bacterium]